MEIAEARWIKLCPSTGTGSLSVCFFLEWREAENLPKTMGKPCADGSDYLLLLLVVKFPSVI